MPSIPFIKKKIGLCYLIWLPKGHKYLLLEEPAWFVFNKTVKRYKATTIASQCAGRYGRPIEESLAFVNDIRSEIASVSQSGKDVAETSDDTGSFSSHLFSPYSSHRYCLGENMIDFSCDSFYLESFLHPLISHLETSVKELKTPLFELFEVHDKIVFRLNGSVKGVWGPGETHLVKGLIFMNLINVMYGQKDDFWLMTVHASAITNGLKTILIPAGPGSGKTTLAAMLQKNGFQLVSDDFVPIDRHEFRAWPFPIAMSVKQGSVNLLSSIYANLEEKAVNYISPEKSVRYLTPDPNSEFSLKAFPVKEFVFLQYNPFVDFEWEKIESERAIGLLLDQSWVSPQEGMAEILIDQLLNWSFYQLTYSNNQKALEAITQLFSHD